MTDAASALAMSGELTLGNTIVCPHCGHEIGAGTPERLAGAPIGQPPTGPLAMIPYPYHCETCGAQLLAYVTGDGNMTGGFYCDHCKRDRDRGVNADEFAAKLAAVAVDDDVQYAANDFDAQRARNVVEAARAAARETDDDPRAVQVAIDNAFDGIGPVAESQAEFNARESDGYGNDEVRQFESDGDDAE